MIFNYVEFLQALLRCQSVTPNDDGAIALLGLTLEHLGFTVDYFNFHGIQNLYATYGEGGPNLCFAGHTDVVPPGDLSLWRVNPFAGDIINNEVYGRGTVDMKGAIAAFLGAFAEFKAQHKQGRISFLITGDEEGQAQFGTKELLQHIQDKIDFCIVGEPTSQEQIGDIIKIGRRGSVNYTLTVTGSAGHAAYPHLADNPIDKVVAILHKLKEHRFDEGSAHFEPTTLVITSIDVNNAASNVIPGKVEVRFNVRTSDQSSVHSVTAAIRATITSVTDDFVLEERITGESFLLQEGYLVKAVMRAIKEVTGDRPKISTGGGTSDARFIKNYCQEIVELGLLNATAHKINEKVSLKDLEILKNMYYSILRDFLI